MPSDQFRKKKINILKESVSKCPYPFITLNFFKLLKVFFNFFFLKSKCFFLPISSILENEKKTDLFNLTLLIKERKWVSIAYSLWEWQVPEA